MLINAAIIDNAMRGDEEASAEQRLAAAGFLCWPMNMLDLAKQDKDLPELVAELAKFIARREKIAVERALAGTREVVNRKQKRGEK